MEITERRYKLVFIEPEEIITAFTALWEKPKCLELPVIPEIPEDARIVEVAYDACNRWFTFLIYHPSFDIVVPPFSIPALAPRTEKKTIQLMRESKQADEPVYVEANQQ